MTSDRKKSSVAFWATVVVVAYILGFGPAVGITSRFRWMSDSVAMIYFPVVFAAQDGPAFVSKPLNWWADLWRG